MGPGGPRRLRMDNNKLKEPLPKNIKEVPGYLKRVVFKFFKRLFYIFGLVWNTAPWILICLTLIALLTGILPVVTAWVASELINILADAYNAAVSGSPIEFSKIISLLIAQFLCIISNSFLSHLNSLIVRISGEMVANHVKVIMMEKSNLLDLQSFDKPEFYERLENAQREAGMRPVQIINATFNTVSTAISVVSFIGILISASPLAVPLILVLALPAGIVAYKYRKKTFNYIRWNSKDRREMAYYSGLITNKDLIKEIRIFGLSDLFVNRYKETFKRYFKGLKKIYVKEGFLNMLVSMLSALSHCALFLYVAWQVWLGKIKVGNYSLYTGALNSITSGINSLISLTSTIYEGTLFIDNLIVFMEEKPTILTGDKKISKIKRHVPHEIEFRNLSFKYPGTERYIIKNLNVTIKAGDTVALVGVNGAGKTTLIKLITRLYDPTEGEILLDGINLKEYDPEELYDIYGIIFQDFGKYAVTVSENIAFGEVNNDADKEKIKLAAEQSNATEFISRLPKGYDTPLMRYFEEDGIELSIGQWQKLSVARAFYSDSDILILDEPTASLDAIAEQEIYDQFDSLRKDKTTIFVSHRLSSATTADVIFVLDNGELVECGPHSELMKNKGVYYKLFTTQAGRYLTENEERNLKEEP
ncbi:MAG: ABC transporter ATP-binding protein [Clostridia bacterium]|nr:ABC transporter ATP-binding protein [Clostridia bacterium]